MSAIPREHRVELSEDEFLVRYAKFNLQVRRAGVRYWIVDLDHLGRDPGGEIVEPGILCNFVFREHLDRQGRPILRIIADETFASRLGIAYTPAGREWSRERRRWAAVVGVAPRRGPSRRRIRREVDGAGLS